MYLMYVDETGDSGLIGSPTAYFALSGIIVHESDWRQFIDTLIAFRRTMKATHGLPVRSEIHSSEFIASKGLPYRCQGRELGERERRMLLGRRILRGIEAGETDMGRLKELALLPH